MRDTPDVAPRGPSDGGAAVPPGWFCQRSRQ